MHSTPSLVSLTGDDDRSAGDRDGIHLQRHLGKSVECVTAPGESRPW